MFDAEVAEQGSLEQALWWVFPPDRSMHVQGLAIDVGDGPAADWLAEEGARFGLCQTLAWEWWHPALSRLRPLAARGLASGGATSGWSSRSRSRSSCCR